ncbi:putative M23-family peptidase [Actinoplanes missouriensis 431]|uniref:Putative M23-family peptidase n=1 Tax=Actinoplanes missouriensis (strain ATCC 14538 / DSM 43046 / CBS 188.64 / JCM 3121 / NBRC 102363 / NCIMB 12654 / NRRL B-3342 / UNCC 431) TaxID=512565 RepID=I0H0F5_ACTM4|nr:M23 family metallopeptidase [Actinoplanes missouriensis]BAL86492.1 putative M23-family peptidase [Actinoplanes missouriensis 431]
MKAKATGLVAGLLGLLVVVCGGGLVFLVTGASGACGTTVPAGDTSAVPVSGVQPVGQWNALQVSHASTIVGVGKGMGVPARGWVIAVATAMQESTLRNLANDNPAYPEVTRLSLSLPHDAVGHDHDSVGLFQQRPLEGDGGWGTVAELMTPKTSAQKFYNALKQVEDWQRMTIGAAAQAVQRSGVPDGYDDDEEPAGELVAALAGVESIEDIGGGAPGVECGIPDDGSFVASPTGWTQPVKAAVCCPWGEDRGDHYHAGSDLSAARGTPIRAAASGTVVVMKCNAPEYHGCDQDGFPGLGGCGWYVDILHAGDVQTRYCHMGAQPLVAVGATVTVGQILGYVGSSGNSSGPHLHYEVHTNSPGAGDNSYANSVDPEVWMATQGAPIGTPE